MIRFPCWNCGKSLKSSPTHAGKKARCSGCDELNTIPSHGIELPHAKTNGLPANDEPEIVKPTEADEIPVLRKAVPKAAGQGMIFCFKCAGTIFEEAEICPHCGVRQRHKKSAVAATLNQISPRIIAGILAILAGVLGAHKFYLGQPFWGVVYLLVTLAAAASFLWFVFFPLALFAIPQAVLWFFCIWEGIALFSMTDEQFAEKYNR